MNDFASGFLITILGITILIMVGAAHYEWGEDSIFESCQKFGKVEYKQEIYQCELVAQPVERGE